MGRWVVLMVLGVLVTGSVMAAPEMPAVSSEELPAVEGEEIDPFAGLPMAVRVELDKPLLEVWKYIYSEDADRQQARMMLQSYLRSPAGVEASGNGVLENSYMYHLLLVKVDLLKAASEHSDAGDNKGIFWFSEGIQRIHDHQSAQALTSFTKGFLSVIYLDQQDYQRLEQVGVKVKYWPSMKPYSNAAFMAGYYNKMSLADKQKVLNIGIAEKIADLQFNIEDIHDRNSDSYLLSSLLYNLCAYIVLEGNNDFYAKTGFEDQPDDLLRILIDKVGFDARDLFR